MGGSSRSLVKINYVSSADLMRLSGIGRRRAESIVAYREQCGPFLALEDLEQVETLTSKIINDLAEHIDWSFNGYSLTPPLILQADARELQGVEENSVDLIVTSPPYWKKRNYDHPQQLGQEESAEEYVEALITTIDTWIPFLRRHASVFINIGDTYRDFALVGIPEMVSVALRKHKWLVVNKIIWAKSNGMPEPLTYRLANRHEVIFQIVRGLDYYSDVSVLAEYLHQSSNPGDVWQIPHARNMGNHLAPFPEELVRRIVEFACPEHVCQVCNKPYTRKLEPTADLDISRPQARRALELFEQAGLTEEHLKAIRAVGISDAGKARLLQTGANANSKRVQELAQEAKLVLGGYFREFTFAQKRQVGWNTCSCKGSTYPGTVLDPFMGSGTTVRVAHQCGRIAIGADLVPTESFMNSISK